MFKAFSDAVGAAAGGSVGVLTGGVRFVATAATTGDVNKAANCFADELEGGVVRGRRLGGAVGAVAGDHIDGAVITAGTVAGGTVGAAVGAVTGSVGYVVTAATTGDVQQAGCVFKDEIQAGARNGGRVGRGTVEAVGGAVEGVSHMARGSIENAQDWIMDPTGDAERKRAQEAGSRGVRLHIFTFSNAMANVNQGLQVFGTSLVHTEVEVFGKVFVFGACSVGTGIEVKTTRTRFKEYFDVAGRAGTASAIKAADERWISEHSTLNRFNCNGSAVPARSMGEDWTRNELIDPTFFPVPHKKYDRQYTYSRMKFMGTTTKNETDLKAFIATLQQDSDWNGENYNLTSRNCIEFCRVLCAFLQVDEIPGWCLSMHTLGEMAKVGSIAKLSGQTTSFSLSTSSRTDSSVSQSVS
eukprot:TRINITY_DN16168_c0_g1_i1.p1 TRINITY_DN16168_c0_g1~~TRINITY_DN16168_c0_g1_i1.p1  ORF type:complete len:412 (-),score=60.01 TRINITY_DN16168_c0_g1_i1:255-1490(-)